MSMDLEEFINNCYRKAERGEMPNATKFNRDLLSILSQVFDDPAVVEQQYAYLHDRILDSCDHITQYNEAIDFSEADEDHPMVINGYSLITPSIAGLQTGLMATNSNMLHNAEGYTHKRWDWTGRGKTTRHRSNAGQIVPINEPFKVINDKTGTVSSMMYPGDPNGNPDNLVCWCKLGLLTMEQQTASIMPNMVGDTINGTVLIDTDNVYNTVKPWNLSRTGITNTYEALRDRLPINVELGHLGKLDQDKLIYDALSFDSVATIDDIELVHGDDGYSLIRVTQSSIDNDIVKPLINEQYINGVSMNYYGSHTVDNDEGVLIESMSLVNDPACEACTIKTASQCSKHNVSDDIMDDEMINKIDELINKRFNAFRDELKSEFEATTTEPEPVEDFKTDRFTEEAYKEQLKKELQAEAEAKAAEDYVFKLHKEGKLGALKPEAAITLAQADFEAFKQSMEMASKSDLFHSVINTADVPNTLAGRAKAMNAGRFANR